VGGARTALYNWLFEKRLGGTFVLRIEDTDADRSEERYIDGICGALMWLGITWDEGPYLQSERRDGYDEAVAKLLGTGHLYACDCTRDDVVARAKDRQTPGYDGFCRDRGLEPGLGRALRFRVPDTGATIVHDIVRGDVEFAHSSIEDFVVVKSNGDPLFVLAVVVDDISMGITHVIRAEEHLPTTPKAILLWHALDGPQLPVFAHLPVLVNAKRQKLSKRRDRVAVEDFRDAGFLPEAMRNYLALLGWGPGDDREVLSLEELIDEFRLEDVIRSPAFFDEKRLRHFNGLYIRALSDKEFVARSRAFFDVHDVPWKRSDFDESVFARLAALTKERVATLAEVAGMVEFAFVEPLRLDEASVSKVLRGDPEAHQILSEAMRGFEECTFDSPMLREVVVGIGETHGRNLAKTQAPIRVATMGRSIGLPLFESLEVLGRSRAIDRLQRAIEQ
jgi:glutamyl-tRNA synthetase